jgi:hypothetical protein
MQARPPQSSHFTGVVPALRTGRVVRLRPAGALAVENPMRMLSVMSLSAAVGAMALLPVGLQFTTPDQIQAQPAPCGTGTGVLVVACADSEPRNASAEPPLPAGDAPAFLLASVQPIEAPVQWRAIYRQVEQCAGIVGDYDRIRWAAMAAPLEGPKGPTFGFTVGDRIVLVYNDTTYLRHEMLHHILQTAGWQPRLLQAGERYTIADLHPMPVFGLCTGGH